MSIGPEVFGLYVAMAERGLFDEIRSVLEFGDQDYKTKGQPHLLDRLFELRGVRATHEDFPEEGEARLIYEKLGLQYKCLDTNEGYGAMLLDLNFDSVAQEHRGRFDLTTNVGTTEHVFDQENAFRVMHDFTRPGGYMVHLLPFVGYVDHGLYCYQPGFFEALARANDYDLLGTWVNTNPYSLHLVPWDAGLLEVTNTFNAENCMIAALLKRKTGGVFIPPALGEGGPAGGAPVSRRHEFVVDSRRVARRGGAAEEEISLSDVPTDVLKVFLKERHR